MKKPTLESMLEKFAESDEPWLDWDLFSGYTGVIRDKRGTDRHYVNGVQVKTVHKTIMGRIGHGFTKAAHAVGAKLESALGLGKKTYTLPGDAKKNKGLLAHHPGGLKGAAISAGRGLEHALGLGKSAHQIHGKGRGQIGSTAGMLSGKQAMKLPGDIKKNKGMVNSKPGLLSRAGLEGAFGLGKKTVKPAGKR